MLTKPTFAEIQTMEPYSDFLASKRTPTTVERYGRHLMDFHAWLQEKELAAVTAGPKELAQFVGSRSRGYSKATVLNICHCLSSFYGYLLATEQVQRNPTAVFRTFGLRRPERRPRPVDPVTEEKLVKSLKHGTMAFERISCVVLLALYEGLRREEIRTLEWGLVDFKNGYITVRGKGDKMRRLVMHPKVRTPLFRLYCFSRYHFGLFPSKYVFRSARSRKDDTVGRQVIDTLFRMAKAWAGLEGVAFSLHCLRHTAGTRMGALASAFETRDFMGHASVATTEIYVQTSERQSHEAYRRAFSVT